MKDIETEKQELNSIWNEDFSYQCGKINLCLHIYRHLKYAVSAELSAQLFQYVMDNFDIKRREETTTINDQADINMAKYADLVQQYRNLAVGLIDSMTASRLSSEEYYTNVWNTICTQPGLKDDFDRSFLVYGVWMDFRTPYFQIGEGISMNNEVYVDIINKLKPTVLKMHYILISSFKQKTQRSSLLVDLLEDLSSPEEKAVLMAQLLNFQETQIRALRKAMEKSQSD